MRYSNANDLLPEALVRQLQQYIQGGYLYVPVDRACVRRWGEATGYRQELQRRNHQIKEAFRQGATIDELSERYFLSVHAIRKIIYQK